MIELRLTEKRKVAWLVLIVVAALSIFISGGVALSNMRSAADESYSGAKGILSDLKAKERAAEKMSIVYKKYDSTGKMTEDLDLTRAVIVSNASPREMFVASRALTNASDLLYNEIDSLGMSDEDRMTVVREHAELLSRDDIIGRSGYNEDARAFNEVINRFPAGLIGGLFGVREMEIFGE